jgi:hypothetical protein
MKRSFLLLLLCLAVLPLYIGCTSDNPVDPSNSSSQYTGSNGIVVNGAGLNNESVEFKSAQFTTLTSPMSLMLMGTTASGDTVNVILTLADSTTGAKTWQNQSNGTKPTGNAGQVLINSTVDMAFGGSSGQTSITLFNETNIAGTFAGTLKNYDASKTIDVNGKFNVSR